MVALFLCTNRIRFLKTVSSMRITKKIPFLVSTFNNTRDGPSFLTNNVFNCHSRANSMHDKKMLMKHKYLNIWKKFLIFHIPCSYDCKESIDIGKDVLKVLRNESSEIASDIVSKLNRCFLIFNELLQ